MSRTIKVVLTDPAMTTLEDLATSADTRTATLAAQLLQHAIAQAGENGRTPPPSRVLAAPRIDRAPWLEPYGGDPDWRQNTWGAIVALHGRYPRHLAHLKDQWWTDDAHTETLTALATWRQELDDTANDPRQELAFHNQLNDYAQRLNQQGGSVTKTWKPAALPPDWERAAAASRPSHTREG